VEQKVAELLDFDGDGKGLVALVRNSITSPASSGILSVVAGRKQRRSQEAARKTK
jgi:hypothetical protein